MTDEEWGRLWAAQNGVGPPSKMCTGKWLWYSAEHNGYPTMDVSLTVRLDHSGFYPSEAAAYAALAVAVREVRREVPDLRPSSESAE